MTTRCRSAAGFTLIEVAFGFLLFGIIAMVLMNYLTSSHQRTAFNSDRVFAFHKAQAILSELQAYVDRGEAEAAIDLDELDDGVTVNPVLTISTEAGAPVPADHPLSGNYTRNTLWTWGRRVTVRPFAGLNNRNVRYVTVRMFRRDMEGVSRQIAELSSVVNSVGSAYPSTQVFDVYLLALENIPGWWVFMNAIKPFVEATIGDLESRNPGLKIRTHWITKSAYGRNRGYAPYVNEAADSTQPIPFVYVYPGKMPAGSTSTHYYVPELIRARVNVDGTIQNDYDATTNPHPYALADRWNHALRYPQERALFDARRASGQESDLEPTWRLLLDDMILNPQRYHNAVVVNLHGELLPMPSMRNYSDAAKEPVALPRLRAVTHPERIYYRRDPAATATEDSWLRVYAYDTNPELAAVPADGIMTRPIMLQIPNVDLTSNINGAGTQTLQIQHLRGGVADGSANLEYVNFTNSTRVLVPPLPTNKFMCFSARYVTGIENYTEIVLYNTPFRHPRSPLAVGGIANSAGSRLYGLEYIPSSVELANDFSRNLSVSGTAPKNTARWRIRLPRQLFSLGRLAPVDQVMEVRTRIGTDVTTGRWFPTQHEPENLSSTFYYWCDSPSVVPFSERYQWQGDMRHCPYADLKFPPAAAPPLPALPFRNGHNWYFDDLLAGGGATASYPGYDYNNRIEKLWMGRYENDLPRHMLFLRTALAQSESVYTTLTGFSYYYVGFGNEIGYDSANGYPNSIPMNAQPFGGSSGTSIFTDSISGGGTAAYRYQKLVREGPSTNTTTSWWGMPWLGELHPDSAAAAFLAQGNLAAGNVAGRFLQARQQDITWRLPAGTVFAANSPIRRTAEEGSTTFFNIGTSASTFHHQFADGDTGNLTAFGLELANNYNFPLPSVALISRPFRLNTNTAGGVGPEWGFTTDYPRFVASILRTYYGHTTGATGSAVVTLTNPLGTQSARIVVNGLDKTIESGTSFIAKYSMLSLVHSFFEAGRTGITHRIKMPPRVLILAPTEITELEDPLSIGIQWATEWKRWDGQLYTSTTSPTFTEPESELVYVVMYSRDGGATFRQVEDDSVSTPGVLPTNGLFRHADTGIGNESYSWNTPSTSFPEGSYVIRVEAYRTGQTLHYSFHQAKIYIAR